MRLVVRRGEGEDRERNENKGNENKDKEKENKSYENKEKEDKEKERNKSNENKSHEKENKGNENISHEKENKGNPHTFSFRAEFPPGVEVRPHQDTVHAVRCLDPSNGASCDATKYFHDFFVAITDPKEMQQTFGRGTVRVWENPTCYAVEATGSPVVPVRVNYTEALNVTEGLQNAQGRPGLKKKTNGTESKEKKESNRYGAKTRTLPPIPAYQLRPYTVKHNLDVVPYDFRLGVADKYKHFGPGNAYGGYFIEVKQRVEQMYRDNGNAKVTLCGHSLGGTLAVLFLNTYVDQKWKDTYIARLISVAAPYAGTMNALQAAVVGENVGSPLPLWTLQPLIATWPGMYMLFPMLHNATAHIWSPDRVLMRIGTETARAKTLLQKSSEKSNSKPDTNSQSLKSPHKGCIMNFSDKPTQPLREYTVRDLPQLVRDMPHMEDIYGDLLESLPASANYYSPPGVPVDCIYSNGVRTTDRIEIDSTADSDRYNPRLHTTQEGDGTVTFGSLQLCSRWGGEQRQEVKTFFFPGIDHVEIMAGHPEVWRLIYQRVNGA